MLFSTVLLWNVKTLYLKSTDEISRMWNAMKCVMCELEVRPDLYKVISFPVYLNLQAEIKYCKHPLRYRYRPSSDEIHFPVDGIH